MKINVVLPTLCFAPPGGFKVMYDYMTKMVEEGHEVNFYYMPDGFLKKYHLSNSLGKILFPIWLKINNPTKIIKLDKRLKHYFYFNNLEDADFLIATSIETVKPVIEAKENKGKKIYFIQGFENWNFKDEEVYESYRLDMIHIVIAKWLKEIVDKYSSKPAYLVSNCINTDIFYDQKLERKKHSIVYHYREAEFRGAKYGFKAIEELNKIYPDLIVDVVSIEDKPDNLPKCCVYHQKISSKEVAEINNYNEIFMCTSIEEGFGLPGLEALACGCALVSTSYKGVLEYAVNNENSLLSPIKNVDSMVENIKKLFEDKDLMNKLTLNGIETGKNRSLDKSFNEFKKILMENR